MADPFPTRFAIFPLPNVVLFPGAQLPLHIFEPRYREMTSHALESGGIIGMTLIRPGESPMQERAPVFDIGCAGRMQHVQQLPDGRYNFVLLGERRFRIRKELSEGTSYRRVEAELLEDAAFDALSEEVRRELETARDHLRMRVLELARLTAPRALDPLRQRMDSLDPVLLCGFLSFALDCSVVEKQTLLETDDPVERLETLIRVIEIRKAEISHAGRPETLN